MAFATSVDDRRPMSDLNTTPLIDVMLVLLIMFILTIPQQSHKVGIDLPSGPPPKLPQPDLVRNRITIDAAGTIVGRLARKGHELVPRPAHGRAAGARDGEAPPLERRARRGAGREDGEAALLVLAGREARRRLRPPALEAARDEWRVVGVVGHG